MKVGIIGSGGREHAICHALNIIKKVKWKDESNKKLLIRVPMIDREWIAVYKKEGSMQNTDMYTVPSKYFFFLGDNRDCSKDSRYLSSVGYVSNENLVGNARMIFFSNDTISGSILKFWNWDHS